MSPDKEREKEMKKRFLATLLAATMVMGMGLTANAAYDAEEIVVNGAGESAKFAALHLIGTDTTTDTGWAFKSTDIAADFKEAFNITDDPKSDADEQKAIWMLIGAQDLRDNSYTVTLPAGVTAAQDSQIATALANVKDGHPFENYTNKVNVTEAGVYYIHGVETNFVYSPMAAYVSFVYNNGEVPESLYCAGVVAKRVPTTMTKDATSVEDADEITEIGRTETYTITATVPYLPETDSNRHYILTDELTGADYVLNENNKVEVTVKIGDSLYNQTYEVAVTEVDADTTTFTLDLSDDLFGDGVDAAGNVLLNSNKYANQTMVVTYEATVTEVHVRNDVKLHDGTNAATPKFGSDDEDLWTGKITLTKYAEDNTPATQDNEVLNGAQFKVYKTVGTTTSWAKFDSDYEFVEWVAAEADATPVETKNDGTLTVAGLDSGTYYFKEVVAPIGYSINEEDVNATLALAVTEATAELTAVTNMIDTKLIALPSTGGIGTTIFTVTGCGIMIAAAFLFFANRKKEEE